MDKINDLAKCKGCHYMNITDYSLRLRHCKKCDNFGDRIRKADVMVMQKPVSVQFECPHCEEEIEIDYQEFCGYVGKPCDWSYSEIKCPRCEKTVEIDDVDWD